MLQLFFLDIGGDYCHSQYIKTTSVHTNTSNVTNFDQNKALGEIFFKTYYKARYTAKLYDFIKAKAHQMPDVEEKSSFASAYLNFLKDNIEHIIVFLLPIFLFAFTLIFLMNLLMKSYKELNEHDRKIKVKNIHLVRLLANYKKRLEFLESQHKKKCKFCNLHKMKLVKQELSM